MYISIVVVSVGESYFENVCITKLRYSLKKYLITLLSYFLWKVMHCIALLFKYEQGLIVCLL